MESILNHGLIAGILSVISAASLLSLSDSIHVFVPLLATDCLHERELIDAHDTHRSFSLCSGNAVDGAKMIGASAKVCVVGWGLPFVCELCVCVFDLCGPLATRCVWLAVGGLPFVCVLCVCV